MKDKEKRITINRGAGARVDLLNKEIEELQKANAIVEMQNVVCKRLCNQDCRICNYYNKNDCIQKDNVDALYERGYRKLPEDSVVLSREEYEKLRSLYDCEQGSYMTSSIGDLPLTVEGSRKAVDEITRLNRVETELQELNAKYYNEAKDLRRELKQARKETAEEILNAVVGAIDNGTFFRKNFIFMMNKVYGVEMQNDNNDKTIEQSNKKIVRQFYNKIQKMLDETRQVIEEPCNGRQNAGYCVADVDNGLKELAKQYGVEVEE